MSATTAFAGAGAGIWHVTVRKDTDTGLFVGHCLNLHVKVAGRNLKETWASLKKVVKAHYEYCYEFDQSGLSLTASAADWAECYATFEKAVKENPGSIVFEEVVLNLRVPQAPEQVFSLPWQGVELVATEAAAA